MPVHLDTYANADEPVDLNLNLRNMRSTIVR